MSMRAKKKTPKKKLTNRQIAIRVLWITAVGVVITAIPAFFIIRNEIREASKKRKEAGIPYVTDSSSTHTNEEFSPKTETLLVIQKDEEEPSDTVIEVEEEPFDSTCAIFYLKGDSIAERDARAVKDFLINATKVSRIIQNPFISYPIFEQDTSWFDHFYPLVKSNTDTNKDVRIYSNRSEYISYEWRPYYYLKEGRWGTKYREYRNGVIRYDGVGGNDQLRNLVFFNDIHEPVVDTTMDLEDWDIAIVIPPFFLTEPVLESLYLLQNK